MSKFLILMTGTLLSVSSFAGTVHRCEFEEDELPVEIIVDTSEWAILWLDPSGVKDVECTPTQSSNDEVQLNCTLEGEIGDYEVVYNKSANTFAVSEHGTFICKD